MDVFFTLISNIFPLYILIALGWVAGRCFNVDRTSLASLAIYIVMPVVSFYYVATLEFQARYLLLPVVVFCLFAGLTLLYFQFTKRLYDDKRANLMAMCAISGNTGYFGLPLVFLLFDPAWIGVYMVALMGGVFHEATVMYYIANRGNFSPKDSVIRVLKFPSLYALIAGGLVNYFQIDLPSQLDPYWAHFKGAYVVIGMMIIGSALAKAKSLVMTTKFLSFTFLGKFALWPLTALGVVAIDQHYTLIFGPEIHKMIILMSIVPPAANITAFAAQLDLNPEKAATTVLLGTIFALFYIPAVLVLSGLY